MTRSVYFENARVNVSWSINMRTQSIFVELIAPVSGSNSWMAFGISDTGGMKGADIGLVSVYHHRIYDLHAVDFELPTMDKVQNYELLYLETMQETNGKYTVAQFKRRLITCDVEDFAIETDRLRHNLMVAYNENDPLLSSTTNSNLQIIRHQYQQRKEVNLFYDEPLFLPQTDDDALFFDFVLPSLSITKRDGNTQYWFVSISGPYIGIVCKVFVLFALERCHTVNVSEQRYLTGLSFEASLS